MTSLVRSRAAETEDASEHLFFGKNGLNRREQRKQRSLPDMTLAQKTIQNKEWIDCFQETQRFSSIFCADARVNNLYYAWSGLTVSLLPLFPSVQQSETTYCRTASKASILKAQRRATQADLRMRLRWDTQDLATLLNHRHICGDRYGLSLSSISGSWPMALATSSSLSAITCGDSSDATSICRFSQ